MIRVPPRGGSYGNFQQTAGQFQTANGAANVGNYGTIQQAATAFQQEANGANFQAFNTVAAAAAATATANFSSGYNTTDTSYASTASVYPQAQQGFSFPAPAPPTTGFPSQQVSPPMGCHPAFCFYV